MSDQSPFHGLAPYYVKYRPSYPPALFQLLKEKFSLDGTGRLLDLGTGTGELAIPLSGEFQEVIAIDVNPEMIEEGKKKAESEGIQNITWVIDSAEKIIQDLGVFRLITAGSSLHWMERELVLKKAYETLENNGGLVVISGRSIWNGTEEWQRRVMEVVKKYLGEKRRAGSGLYPAHQKDHEEVLRKSKFQDIEERKIISPHTWSTETILGNLYSTSFAAKHLFGEKLKDFENDVRNELLAINPSGTFQEQIPREIILAWKRESS